MHETAAPAALIITDKNCDENQNEKPIEKCPQNLLDRREFHFFELFQQISAKTDPSWSTLEDFKELVESGAPLADKTLLIKEIIESDNKNILVTRPRGFGKTINLSMLYHFLSMNESNADLFKRFDIYKERGFFDGNINNHPTIYLSFKYSDPLAREKSFHHNFQWAMSELYQKFRFVRGTIKEELDLEYFDMILNRTALEQPTEIAVWELSRHLYRVFNKTVILLFDGCDSPVQHGFYFNFYSSMRNAVINCLQTNLKYLNFDVKIIITGITNIPLKARHIEENDVFTVLDNRLSKYFGLTDEEVEEMILSPKLSHLDLNLISLHSWYGGYTVGHRSLFNPRSLQKCFENKGVLIGYSSYQPHDEFTSLVTGHGIPPVIESEVMLMHVEVPTLLSKTLDYERIYAGANVYYHTLMVFQGYYVVNSFNASTAIYRLKIPNLEVRELFKTVLKKYPRKWGVPKYVDFLRYVHDTNKKKVGQALTEYLKIGENIVSYQDSLTFIPHIFRGLEKYHGDMEMREVQGTMCLQFRKFEDMLPTFLIGVSKTMIRKPKKKDYESVLDRCINACKVSKAAPNFRQWTILVGEKDVAANCFP